MPLRHFACCRPIVAAAVLSGIAAVAPAARQSPGVGPSATSGLALLLDVVAADRTGAAVDDLGADDFVVTVDGVRRRVTSIRYVTRGPGALNDTQTLDAARSATDGSVARSFAAEPARTVVVVIDQTTLLRGDEKATTAAVRSAIDRLGLDDRVGIVRLPLDGSQTLDLSSDRPSLLASLRGVMGQVTVASLPAPTDPFAASETDRLTALNPERAGSSDRTAVVEQERVAVVDSRSLDPAARRDQPLRGNVADLQALFLSLRSAPGRKVVLLFSGGLTIPDENSQIDGGSSERAFSRAEAGPSDPAVRSFVAEASLAAARAHTVVQAFGLKSNRLAAVAPDAGALEALARATGGQFTALGRNADQATARVLADLSACYVLGLEGPASPDTGTRHAVRVASARPTVVVRAPAWLVPRADAADVRQPSAAASPVTGLTVAGVAVADVPQNFATTAPGNARAPLLRPRDAASATRQAQLRRLLARVADYVETYQREYSSVVAEEDYEQSDWRTGATKKIQRTRSDLLLVRLDHVTGWLSFRDIYEVDGKPVRERDERLQRLFLDPSVESRERLAAIQVDSSRYNLGPVTRTVNAPLFPLTFLERAMQARFRFSMEDTKELDGLPVAQIDYVETASPTISETDIGTDQPAYGRFLVDPVSGAVVESRTVYARAGAGQIEYVIRYRRDDRLGLLVPLDMNEVYGVNSRTLTMGLARYRNFRRFEVSTDTRVTVPK